jgi:glycosyltransferase involved in cell wall biosynthesis
MPNPTILWITPGFAAAEQDDTCIPPLQLLARALKAQGVSLQIIALEYPYRNRPYEWHSIPVWPCGGANRKWLRWRTHHRARRYAHRIIKSGEVVAMHSFWLGQAWWLGRHFNIQYPTLPHYTTLMGQDVLPDVNGYWLRRARPQDAFNWVAVSSWQARQMQQIMGFPPAHVIPWGVEISDRAAALRPVHIIGVGSLLPVKNWLLWLDVVHQISLRKPDLKAVLIGEGSERNTLEQRIKHLQIGHVVTLAGACSRADVWAHLAQAQVLLHTSRFESYGMVLAEAAAAGCAVVSTDVGVASDVGFVSDSLDKLSEATFQRIDNQTLSVDTTGAPHRFDVEISARAYRQLWLQSAPVDQP